MCLFDSKPPSRMCEGGFVTHTKKDAIKRPKNKEIQGDKECFSVSDTGASEVKNSSPPDRSRSYDLLVTSLDTLPLMSYRRFEGAKTTLHQESNLRPSGY